MKQQKKWAWAGRSLANLKDGNIQGAIKDLDRVIEAWLLYELDMSSFGPIFIAGSNLDPNITGSMEELLFSFLSGPKVQITDEIRGQLHYLEFKKQEYNAKEGDKPNYELLLKAAQLTRHPAISRDLSCYYLENKNYEAAVQHHLSYAVWRYQTWESYKSYHQRSAQDTFPSVYAEFSELIQYFNGDETCAKRSLSKTARKQIHGAAIKGLIECKDAGMILHVFVPFFLETWHAVLTDGAMTEEALQVVDLLLAIAPENQQLLWHRAYTSAQLGKRDEAINAYQSYLEKAPNDPAALHNLSVLVEQEGDIDGALKLSREALSVDSDDEDIRQRFLHLNKILDERSRELARLQNFLRTAPERSPQLDRSKKQILSTMAAIEGFDDFEDLARLTGIEERYIEGHCRKLIELGMIVKNSKDQPSINEYILPLIQQERSHSVITRIIHANSDIAFKPIFNSQQEYNVYHILANLFPNHLVFPNMSLQSIFQYDRMKDLLSQEEFTYFLRSQVDACVVSTTNYLPIIAFEIDSHYHDLPDQHARDQKKNRIFELGGVPLMRLRGYGNPSEGTIRHQISDALQEWIKHRGPIEGVRINLMAEIDFEKFKSKTTR